MLYVLASTAQLCALWRVKPLGAPRANSRGTRRRRNPVVQSRICCHPCTNAGLHERLAPERERGPPFAHASKCVNGHSPFTHGWGLLHPFAHVYGTVTYTESLLKRGVYFTQGRTVYDSTLQCTDARRQDVCVSLV